jgi:EpsI family protein
VAIAVLAAPHAWTAYGLYRHQPGADMANCTPTPLFGDLTDEPDWRPGYDASPDYSSQGQVDTPAGPVDVYVAYYRAQTKDRELVGWNNKPYDGKTWALHEVLPGPTGLAWDMPPPDVSRLRNAVKDRRIVWTWYWVDGRFTGNPLTAKLWQARAVLEAHNPESAALLLSIAENFDPASAEPKLRAALRAMGDPKVLMKQVVRAACPAQAQTPTRAP